MESIGIIGAGNIGKSFALQATAAGYKVVIANSGHVDKLAAVVAELGSNAVAGTLDEVVSQPIVLFAARWSQRDSVFTAVKDWGGRILIDASNQFLTHAPDFSVDPLDGRTSSEMIAELASGARVVKALNTVPAAQIAAGPAVTGGRRVVFLSGNDQEAKAEVIAVFKTIGFAPIDLGGLREGGKMQQLAGPLAGVNLALLDD